MRTIGLLMPCLVWAQATLPLNVGDGKLIMLDRPARTVYLANPEVADVQAPTPTRLFVSGKAAGTTVLYALNDAGDVVLEQQIKVNYDIDTLRDMLRARFPSQSIKISAGPGSVLVTGRVDSQTTQAAVIATISRYMGNAGEIIDQLTVATPSQVNLNVRIAEISKTIDRAYGFNWQSILNSTDMSIGLFNGQSVIDSSGGWDQSSANGNAIFGQYNSGNVNLNTMIDALETENLVRVLAEPNMTAISGETASFLAGGQVPVSSTTDGVASVSFKDYGVSLKFTPQVLSRDRIRMAIAPEVSQLVATSTNSGGLPSLDVRQMSTVVELADGQSFAIGGLLQNNQTNTIDRVPVLGNMPILGSLFRSKAFARKETELVVIVTPSIIESPMGDGLSNARNALMPVSGLELILGRDQQSDGIQVPAPTRLQGGAGFVY